MRLYLTRVVPKNKKAYWKLVTGREEMKLIITAGEALDYDWWERVCDIKGINVWAVKEGLMNREDEITLTQEELLELGILTF